MQLGRQPEESRRSRRSRCLRGTHGKMQMKSSHAYNRICCSSYINLSQFLCAGHKHNLCLIQPGPGLRGSLSLSIMTFCCCFVSCATADDGGSHFADHKPMIEAASLPLSTFSTAINHLSAQTLCGCAVHVRLPTEHHLVWPPHTI